MEEKKVFNKAKYDMELRKKLEIKQFNTDLSKEDYKEVNDEITKLGISKALFIRIAKNNLKKGMLKMTKCEEIKDYLKGKNIKIEREEVSDFDLGNHPSQSEENTIELENGYLFYIINKDENKCYITLSRRTNPNDINDEYLEDDYFDGYFDIKTLENLLKLL